MKVPLSVLVVVSIIVGMLLHISFTNTSMSIVFPLVTNVIVIAILSSMCVRIYNDKK